VISAFSDVESALVAMQQTDAQEMLEEDAVATALRSYEISVAQLGPASSTCRPCSTRRARSFSQKPFWRR
jgi:hypothetical protein